MHIEFLKKSWAFLSSEHNLPVRDIVTQYIDNQSSIAIATQADLLGIARTSVYYQPQPVSEEDVTLMHEIDRIYTDCPFYGVRRITAQLHRNGMAANHKRVHRLMQAMGIEAIDWGY